MSRAEAREYLMKSKIYRFMAMTFAAIGVLVFMYIIYKMANGDPMRVLENPATIAFVFIPFLPAIVLAMSADRAEKRLTALLTRNESPESDQKKTAA